MPGVSRDNDTAVGDLVPSQSSVYANNEEIIVNGDSVAPHAPLIPPHLGASMIAGSNKVFVENKAVVNAGDSATCGHTSTGSSDVFVGD